MRYLFSEGAGRAVSGLEARVGGANEGHLSGNPRNTVCSLRRTVLLGLGVLVLSLTDCLADAQRLRERIYDEMGLNSTVSVKVDNGVTTVRVFLLDPLRTSPAVARSHVELLVKKEFPDVAHIVVFGRL